MMLELILVYFPSVALLFNISKFKCFITSLSSAPFLDFWGSPFVISSSSLPIFRSSHQRCSLIKDVPRNLTKFTGKQLCQSLLFNKVAGLRPTTLLKKTLAQVFSSEFCQISKNTFFTEHLWTTAFKF